MSNRTITDEAVMQERWRLLIADMKEINVDCLLMYSTDRIYSGYLRCVNGGGQPIRSALFKAKHDIRAERASALYKNDENCKIRKSHENPAIKELYSTYLEKPGSHRAHELLHTSYVAR